MFDTLLIITVPCYLLQKEGKSKFVTKFVGIIVTIIKNISQIASETFATH